MNRAQVVDRGLSVTEHSRRPQCAAWLALQANPDPAGIFLAPEVHKEQRCFAVYAVLTRRATMGGNILRLF